MKRSLVLIPLFVLFLVASSAAGSDRGFLLSAKWGSANNNSSLGDQFEQVFDGEDDSQAYELGFRFNRYIQVVGSYYDLGQVPGFGSPCAQDDPDCLGLGVPLQTDAEAIAIAVMPSLPLLASLTIYAKVGLVRLDNDVSALFDDLNTAIDSSSTEELLLGVGVRLGLIGPIEIFGEFEQLGDNLDVVSFGATLKL